MKFIRVAPHNESALTYLLGLISPPPTLCLNGNSLSEIGIDPRSDTCTERLLSILEEVENLVEQDISGAADSPVLLSFFVEVLIRDLNRHMAANHKY